MNCPTPQRYRTHVPTTPTKPPIHKPVDQSPLGDNLRDLSVAHAKAAMSYAHRSGLYGEHTEEEARMTSALPPVVDHDTWRTELDELRRREKAATRELDAIAAQRRRLPMVELPDYTLIGADGPVRLVDVFDGRSPAHRLQPHVVRRRGVAVRRLHRAHVAVGPAGLPGATTTPASSSSPTGPSTRRWPTRPRSATRWTGTRRRESSFGADVGAPPEPRLRRQRVPPRRRHRVPHLAHRRPRHRAAQLHLRA